MQKQKNHAGTIFMKTVIHGGSFDFFGQLSFKSGSTDQPWL